MTDWDAIQILICPETRGVLERASARLMARLNDAIRAGKVSSRSGRAVVKPLEGGLLRADKAVLYPVRDGIPVLLVDEAIEISKDWLA